MRKLTAFALLFSLSLLTACASSARFVHTDPSYHPTPGMQDPEVYLDRKPPQLYRTVGILEVTLDEDATAQMIRNAVVPKGREVGCGVLVEWGLHEKVSLAPRTPDGHLLILVHEGSEREQHEQPAKPRRSHRFACGVLTAGPASVVHPA